MEETRVVGENHWHVATFSLYTPCKTFVTSYAHFHKRCCVTTCMRCTLQFQIQLSRNCILKVYHVFILYPIVVIHMLDFKNTTWRLIYTRFLNYNMFVDLTPHISQRKNVLYSIWHLLANERTCCIVFFLNVW